MTNMKRFSYQLHVQWDESINMYVAYSPTVSTFAARFFPNFDSYTYGGSISVAASSFSGKYECLERMARKEGILMPPPDVGGSMVATSTEYVPLQAVT